MAPQQIEQRQSGQIFIRRKTKRTKTIVILTYETKIKIIIIFFRKRQNIPFCIRLSLYNFRQRTNAFPCAETTSFCLLAFGFYPFWLCVLKRLLFILEESTFENVIFPFCLWTICLKKICVHFRSVPCWKMFNLTSVLFYKSYICSIYLRSLWPFVLRVFVYFNKCPLWKMSNLLSVLFGI